MKVLLVNGSPIREGNTYVALSEVARALQAEGIESEILHPTRAGLHSLRRLSQGGTGQMRV